MLQPLVSLVASQFAKPVLQVPLSQEPLLQARLMLFEEQTAPQPPQLLASTAVCVSQPSLSLLLLQSDQPPVQVPLHRPLPQVRVCMLAFEQTLAHPPQLLASMLEL